VKIQSTRILEGGAETKEQCKTMLEKSISMAIEHGDRLISFKCTLPNIDLQGVLDEIDQRECYFHKAEPGSEMIHVSCKELNDIIMG